MNIYIDLGFSWLFKGLDMWVTLCMWHTTYTYTAMIRLLFEWLGWVEIRVAYIKHIPHVIKQNLFLLVHPLVCIAKDVTYKEIKDDIRSKIKDLLGAIEIVVKIELA